MKKKQYYIESKAVKRYKNGNNNQKHNVLRCWTAFLEKFRFSRDFLRFSRIFRFWLLASLHLNDSLSQIIHNLKSAFWGVFDGFLWHFSLSITSRAFFFVFLAPYGHFHGYFCDFLAYVYFCYAQKR